MNRAEFLSDPDVDQFTDWLAAVSSRVVVDFHILSTGYVPRGLSKSVVGLKSVLDNYSWRSSWPDGVEVIKSSDWDSTARSLARLKDKFTSALVDGSDDACFEACDAALKWGGERNRNEGARPFLVKKREAGELVSYLKRTRDALTLEGANLHRLSDVEMMNSMLTKVHAFASQDGLPIYDSRVAAAIAGLVELFRLEHGKHWRSIPAELSFPAIAASKKRQVTSLHDAVLSPIPAKIYYGASNATALWSSAIVRLGWLIEAALEKAPELFKGQPHSRMHALEATLFMIGYDVNSLAPNLKNPSAGAERDLLTSPAA